MLVETRSLTKRYGPVTALHNCHLQIGRGEVFGLLGPNGAGKTTLLRLLMGFLRPTAGWARIDGLDSYADSVAVHRRVSYLPGDVRLFRSMRAQRVLDFFCEVRPDGDRQRARNVARRLDLNLSTRVNRMSTGMRQKLALAATLSADTPLIILDEPTSNLDPNVRSRVAQMVLEARSEGRTVLFSSHVLPEVEDTCDRVAILCSGRLVHEQVLSELRREHRIVAELMHPMPEVPDRFRNEVTIYHNPDGVVVLETPGELQPLLGWLATLPLREVRIEPIGLRAVYDRFHPAEDDLPATTSAAAPRRVRHASSQPPESIP